MRLEAWGLTMSMRWEHRKSTRSLVACGCGFPSLRQRARKVLRHFPFDNARVLVLFNVYSIHHVLCVVPKYPLTLIHSRSKKEGTISTYSALPPICHDKKQRKVRVFTIHVNGICSNNIFVTFSTHCHDHSLKYW